MVCSHLAVFKTCSLKDRDRELFRKLVFAQAQPQPPQPPLRQGFFKGSPKKTKYDKVPMPISRSERFMMVYAPKLIVPRFHPRESFHPVDRHYVCSGDCLFCQYFQCLREGRQHIIERNSSQSWPTFLAGPHKL